MVHRVTCNLTVTKKGLILYRRNHTGRIELVKQESVFSPTTKKIATMLTLESGLEQEEVAIKTTHVETMETGSISKPWDISWFSEENTNTFFNDNNSN